MKTKLFTLVLALIASTSIVSAWDYERIPIGDLCYNLDATAETAEVAGANMNPIIIVNIPSSVTYNGVSYSVTSIRYGAFDYCSSMTSVTIGSSVTSIGQNAFYGCSGLLSVTLGNNVTSIGDYAFYGCTGLPIIDNIRYADTYLVEVVDKTLTSYKIKENTKFIGQYAFYNCSSLTSITIPNSVTSIGGSAFSGCSSLTSITIPNSVTSIGSSAFSGCTGLTSITIPNSVTSIKGPAFSGCSSLVSISVEHENPIYDSRSNCNAIIETATNTLIAGCQNTIIPNSVTSIGKYAFYGCRSLTSVTIPTGVTSIGDEAFRGCSSLTSITIPNSVTSIGGGAFLDCSKLNAVHISDIAAWCAILFNDYLSNPLYYARNLSLNGNLVTDLTIPNSVTSIKDYAFYGCTGLTSVTIGNGVTSIRSSAFYGCSGLLSVTLGNNVTSIGDYAFYGCTGLPVIDNIRYADTYLVEVVDRTLSSYKIKEGTRFIGPSAFASCNSLTSITIPNSVTSIGGSAFSGCNSLKSVTIPNSVTSIGDYAFEGCTGLPVIDNVRYADTYLVEVVDWALSSYKIKEGTRFIGDYAFEGCDSLTFITIPNSVTSIGRFAFSSCRSLTSVTIPNGVTSIGERAFDECHSLTSVTIGNSVTSIGWYAFNNCFNLSSVTIPSSVTSIGGFAFYGVPHIIYYGTAEGAPWNARCMNGYVEGNLVYRDSTKTELWACFATATGEITIPNSVTSIRGSAFRWCSKLTSVTIPNSVTSIGIYAFRGCTGLTAVTIGSNVTSIEGFAFFDCTSLTTVTIPNSVISIGEYAFSGVPNIVYSGIATGAPWEAKSLNGYVEGYLVYRDATKTELLACSAAATSITIPSSVTSLGDFAFWRCNLKDIFVPCGELLERFTQMFNSSDYNKNYSNILKVGPAPYTLTIKDTKYGSVSVPDYNGCDESIMITAIPDPHCRFVKWSDGNTDNPRSVYLTEDITLEALFVYTLTDKCGKDYLLTWTLDTLKMAIDITGKGSLSDNYTYHTTFATLTIGNEVTTIGANAFSDCDNLQYLTLGSSVRVIESGAFACSDIKTITCYNKRPPTVNNDAFCNLDYETIIYVPKDYLENYQMHAFWGMFDVRPIGASGTETDKVKVEPSETTATVAWPTISGAGSYELVIRDKDGNALCTLVFNAQGQLTSIDFAAAPARDRSNVAAMAQGAGFAFTVTGLESGTMYKYSFITKNASGTVIDTKTGAFTTQSPTAVEDIMDNASSSSSVRKVLHNGQLYILRDGKVYNAVGAEVK